MDQSSNDSNQNVSGNNIAGNIKHWWILLILALLCIGIGFFVLLNPLDSYPALAIIFAISFLIGGVSSLSFAILNRKTIPFWGWNLAMSIIVTILGLILVFNLNFTESVLAFYVAFSLLFSGFNSISMAFVTKAAGDKNWGWSLALGIITAFLAILLMLHPVFTALTIVFMTSFGFIMLGVSLLFLTYQVYKLNKKA